MMTVLIMMKLTSTWKIVGYLKPRTERTYLLVKSPSTRMTTKIAAAPRFIPTLILSNLHHVTCRLCSGNSRLKTKVTAG